MMFLRYLVAVPLILLSYAGVPFGYLTLSSYLFQRSLPGRREEFDFAAEFAEKFTDLNGFWPVPLALLLFVVLWWMTAAWTRIALLPSVPVAFVGLVAGTGWEKSLLSVATPLVAWGLAWLAAKAVTWPVTGDVRRSAVEVLIGLRGGGRLRVQSRRLLLDKLPPPRHKESPVGRVAIPFDRIGHVEAGLVTSPAQWRFGNTSELTITPGPVLRIIGGGQQWLLPVDDVEQAMRLVLERAKVRAKADPRPPLDSSRWANAKRLWDLSPSQPMQPNQQKVKHGMHHVMLVLSVLTAAMAGYAVFRAFTGSWSFVFGALIFGGVSYGTARGWASLGATMKLAEENPHSPLADDPDPRRRPVTGWSPQPVTLGQTSGL
ncbi:hypothetical protein [Lentzea californiensis]|uniref:hypothetical protein n=1 Tax=Lentzea californiensis TaxID=438851 RepID=UPI0021660386|nr:hypothetical protein [Lentzea californiensis]MCR3754545.1 hypothetical protein [Lentzea californiensis]